MLPCEIKATRKCARFIGALAITPGNVNVRFIALLSPLDRTQGPVCGRRAIQRTPQSVWPLTGPRLWRKSRSSHLIFLLDPAAWELPCEINATKNCARCNGGLAITPGEVDMRFIALLSPFDRIQGSV